MTAYRYNGKSIFRFPLRFNIIRILVKRLIPPLYRHLHNKELCRLIKKEEFDIVFCHFGTHGASIIDVCKKSQIPLVVHFHGVDAFRNDIIKKYITDRLKSKGLPLCPAGTALYPAPHFSGG